MPTIIHFIGVEKPVTLQEDYDQVTKALQGREVGLFGENTSRVAIYKAGVAYIEEVSEQEGFQRSRSREGRVEQRTRRV
jgi:hypothetical protein